MWSIALDFFFHKFPTSNSNIFLPSMRLGCSKILHGWMMVRLRDFGQKVDLAIVHLVFSSKILTNEKGVYLTKNALWGCYNNETFVPILTKCVVVVFQICLLTKSNLFASWYPWRNIPWISVPVSGSRGWWSRSPGSWCWPPSSSSSGQPLWTASSSNNLIIHNLQSSIN